jgi:hypothetical protein
MILGQDILQLVVFTLVVIALHCAHAGVPARAGTGHPVAQPQGKPTTTNYVCPEPVCDVACPIPPEYFTNRGQLCTSLTAHWMGSDYCKYTINQAIRVNFKINGDQIYLTQGKRAFDIERDRNAEALRETVFAPFAYLLIYWVDYYLTHLTLMGLLLPILRFFLRAQFPTAYNWISRKWRGTNGKSKKDE